MSVQNKIVNAFRSKGYKATPQRITIAQMVLSSKDHPSTETIYKAVRRLNPTLSLSTVYNTLRIMKEIDLVNELAFSDKLRYDPNTDLHINLICERCGKIMDLENLEIEQLLQRISNERGFNVTGHRLEFYGICKKCVNKQHDQVIL